MKQGAIKLALFFVHLTLEIDIDPKRQQRSAGPDSTYIPTKCDASHHMPSELSRESLDSGYETFVAVYSIYLLVRNMLLDSLGRTMKLLENSITAQQCAF